MHPILPIDIFIEIIEVSKGGGDVWAHPFGTGSGFDWGRLLSSLGFVPHPPSHLTPRKDPFDPGWIGMDGEPIRNASRSRRKLGMQLRAIRRIPKADGNAFALDRGRKKGCKVEAIRGGIYDHPHAYDVAFSYRNVREETDFLSAIMEKHGRSGTFEDFLEVGCGPARHCLELGRRGKRCFGLDSNPNMVQYAREKVHKEGLEPTRIEEGDMRFFDIDRSFDLICCLLGTLSHLHTQEDLVATFQRCAQHNKTGGLFVVEIAHPADLFDGSLMDQQGDAWEAEEDGLHIVVEWGREGDYFCPITQIMERTVGLSALSEGGELMYSLQEVVSQRQFTLPEIRSLAMLVGYEYVGAYGEMNPSLQVLPESEDACRLVIILRKR